MGGDGGGHLRLLSHQFFIQVVLVLLLFSVPRISCQQPRDQNYQPIQLDALQAVWGAWNGSTPKQSSNLAGWSSSQRYPCQQYITGGVPNWRGVECLTNINCFNDTSTGTIRLQCDGFVIGLTLNDALIAGVLPKEIGNINTLTTLELTGNPKLTGNIPGTLQGTQLITLDLHDNDFYGEIPNLGSFEWPLTVDLSGNRLNGSADAESSLDRLRTMKYLQKLNLGRNDFEGEIPNRFFDSMKQLVELDLSGNKFNGTLPTLTMIENLQTLNMSHNSFTGTLPNLTVMPSLLTVDLSRNNLSGALPALELIENIQTLNLSRNELTGSVLGLDGGRSNTSLLVVDLSHNQLTAALDSWNRSQLGILRELYLDFNLINGTLNVGELYSQGLLRTKSANSSGRLRVLSVMNNSIDTVVYDGMNIEDITTIFRLDGNPYCNIPDSNDGTRCFCKQICFNSVPMSNDNKRKVVITAVVSVVTSLLVILITVVALLYRNRRYKRYLQLQVQQKFEEFEVKPTIFPYNQLRTATRDFHPDVKLGEGAYGAVYKGILPNGSVVAVKQLFGNTNQGIDEFLNEVVLLTGMKHRNLVNLKGCCIREQQRLLVYEYVDNHDIDHVLLAASPNKALLSWPVRLRICLGVARGLHYLHALAQPRIIHRDIKASNVLLAQNYEAKIADFGLAFLFPDEEISYILTKHVAGTKGYLAPEYASYGQLSDKVDVFSFGVLCLEVVSGRRNIDEKLPPNQMYLSKWAWELHRAGNLMDLVDSTISLQGDETVEVQRVINTALLCIQHEAEERPSMERVVAMLQGDSESEAVTVLKPGDEESEYLDKIRLRVDVGMSSVSGLATVTEEEESTSFMDSARRGASGRSDVESDGFSFPSTTLQLSNIRVR